MGGGGRVCCCGCPRKNPRVPRSKARSTGRERFRARNAAVEALRHASGDLKTAVYVQMRNLEIGNWCLMCWEKGLGRPGKGLDYFPTASANEQISGDCPCGCLATGNSVLPTHATPWRRARLLPLSPQSQPVAHDPRCTLNDVDGLCFPPGTASTSARR